MTLKTENASLREERALLGELLVDVIASLRHIADCTDEPFSQATCNAAARALASKYDRDFEKIRARFSNGVGTRAT